MSSSVGFGAGTATGRRQKRAIYTSTSRHLRALQTPSSVRKRETQRSVRTASHTRECARTPERTRFGPSDKKFPRASARFPRARARNVIIVNRYTRVRRVCIYVYILTRVRRGLRVVPTADKSVTSATETCYAYRIECAAREYNNYGIQNRSGLI